MLHCLDGSHRVSGKSHRLRSALNGHLLCGRLATINRSQRRENNDRHGASEAPLAAAYHIGMIPISQHRVTTMILRRTYRSYHSSLSQGPADIVRRGRRVQHSMQVGVSAASSTQVQEERTDQRIDCTRVAWLRPAPPPDVNSHHHNT